MPIPLALSVMLPDAGLDAGSAPNPGVDALLLTDVADNLLLTDAVSLLLLAV